VKAEYVPYLPSAKKNTVSWRSFEIQRDKFVTQPVKGKIRNYLPRIISIAPKVNKPEGVYLLK